LEENEEALELWQAVSTQWRASGFGLVGLDYMALWKAAEVLEIEMTSPLFKKIQALERFELARARDDRAGEEKKSEDTQAQGGAR
jgi:hypothetical protein